MQKMITLIISRNYGPPLAFNIPLRRLITTSVVLLGVLGVLVYATLTNLVHSAQNQRLKLEIERIRQQFKILQEQNEASNQRAYERKTHAFYSAHQKPPQAATNLANLSANNTQQNYQIPIQVAKASARANRKRLEVVFQLRKTPNAPLNLGGYLFVVFTNAENFPNTHTSAPQAKINPAGFPQYYKYGAYLPPFRRSLQVRKSIRHKQQRFSYITLYIFSGRGGLVLRERFALGPSLFESNATTWVLRDLQKKFK